MDNQFGRLMLIQGQTQLRIYRINHSSADFLTKFGSLKDRQTYLNAQFLPFASGIAVLSDKQEAVDFHQIL